MNTVKADRLTPGNKLPVRWYSLVFNATGYADEARNMLMHLNQEKFEVKVIPIDRPNNSQEVLEHECKKKLYELMHNADHPGSVNISWIPVNQSVIDPNAIANICRTMFETDRIPPAWVKACNNMDEIWVPSQFNVETFAQAGVSVDKLFIIPGGIDHEKYSSDITPMNWPDKKGFNFLSIFEWADRKGWDILLRAYLTEFKKTDDVALILKANTHFTTMQKIQYQIYNYILSLGFRVDNIPHVFLLEKYYTGKEMAALYAACDAFVLPSRGEGWGRPYMEAMAMGLPTIGTRWSAQLTFMHDDNSYLIDINGLEDVPPTVDIPIFRGHRWARPSMEHTMALMRQVYENREQAREKGSIARREVIQKWSWAKAAEKVEQRLERCW